MFLNSRFKVFCLGLSVLPLSLYGLGCAKRTPKSPERIQPKEIKVVDPALAQSMKPESGPKSTVVGNIWIETQENASSQTSRLFLKAVFHKPTEKNMFLEGLRIPKAPEPGHDHDHDHDHGPNSGPSPSPSPAPGHGHDHDHDHVAPERGNKEDSKKDPKKGSMK